MGISTAEKKQSARTARLGLRASPQQQLLIRQAAEVLNKSVTEFILDSACRAAENTLLNQRFFLLDDEEWRKFQQAIEQPARLKPGLKKLIQEKAPWE